MTRKQVFQLDPNNYCILYNYILLLELEFFLIMLTEERNEQENIAYNAEKSFVL